MNLLEIWSKKPTNVWLHRLNKDGSESGMRDARRYYASKQDALMHHNSMVDANPGKEIAHNLHVQTQLGNFKMKLVGKQTGRAESKKERKYSMDDLLDHLTQRGASVSAWMTDKKLEELLKLFNDGADIKTVNGWTKGMSAQQWFDAKEEMMQPKGYRVFDKYQLHHTLEMVFVRD